MNLSTRPRDTAGYAEADCVIIATPTNYIPENNSFDTTSIEAVLDVLTHVNPTATIVIKSTVPVGYLESLKKRYSGLPNLLFSPEFLREGKALYCARARHCTTTCTHPASLWARQKTVGRIL